MTERDSAAPADAMLSRSARRVRAFIERRVVLGTNIISCSDIEAALHMPHATCCFALRQVTALGFMDSERVPVRGRRVNFFRLSTRWQTIDAVEAHRLATQARQPQKRMLCADAVTGHAMTASPAYRALPPSAQRMLGLIEQAVARGNGSAAISHTNFHELGMRPGTCGLALRALVQLGFVSVTPGQQRINVFRLCDTWRSLDADEAKRLLTQSGNQPKRAPQPVRPRSLKRQAPSLPRMHFADDP